MKEFFVTGGAGFIGSHVVDALVARGDRVTVVDSFDPAAHAGEPDYLNPDAEYLRCDVRASASWDRAAGADAVIHLAGKVGLGVSFADTPDYVSHNDQGMATGLARLAELKSDAPFVLASSMVVYGEGRYRCAEHGVVRPAPRSEAALSAGDFDPPCPVCGAAVEPEPVSEEAPLEPRNVYAATKVHQEHLLNCYANDTHVRSVALRFHNVYGRRMPANNPYSGVAAIFASAALSGHAPQVFEDGCQIRDFVHVTDVARAVIAAADRDSARGPYNIGSGQARPIIDMAEAVVAAAGSSIAPHRTGAWRSGDVRHVFADSTRMRTQLGVSDTIALEVGATDLVAGSLRAASHGGA